MTDYNPAGSGLAAAGHTYKYKEQKHCTVDFAQPACAERIIVQRTHTHMHTHTPPGRSTVHSHLSLRFIFV